MLRMALPGRGRLNNRSSIVVLLFISIGCFLAVYFDETVRVLTQVPTPANDDTQDPMADVLFSSMVTTVFVEESERACTSSLNMVTVTVTVTSTERVTLYPENAQPDNTMTATIEAPQPTVKSKYSADVFRAYEEDYQKMLTSEDYEVMASLRSYEPKSFTTKDTKPGYTLENIPIMSMQREAHIRAYSNLYSIGSGLPSAPATWIDYLDGISPDTLAPLTHIAQRFLHNHQNPAQERCENGALFLVLPSYRKNSGLGSILHGASHALSAAIRSGRILIYDERDGDGEGIGMPGIIFSGSRVCNLGGDRRALGVDCFFERITSCSWKHVSLDGLNPNALIFKPYDIHGNINIKHPEFGFKTRYGDIPPVLGALLLEWEDINSAGSGIRTSPNARKLWWRSQAVGYLARINNHSLDIIRRTRLREAQDDNSVPVKHIGLRGNSSVNVPFPLPQGIFSIHVRHGDKGTEMDLVQFSEYALAAEKIANENPWRGLTSKTAFVTTEDPKVIDEMRALATDLSPIPGNHQTTSNLEWTFFWTDGVPRHNSGPAREMNEAGSQGTEFATALLHLGELLMGLEATAGWVGTRASNWCKLLDELAGVWVGRGGIFVEVGDPIDWADYHF